MAEARIALVGAGVIGRRHLAAIAECAGVKLAAIVDPLPAVGALARDHRVPHCDGIQTMLEAIRPDGVIVATPTEHHLAPTLAALDAGAHVLVEKPVTATLDDADRLVAASQAARRHVLVGHHRRYYECVRRAREIVQGGRLGKLVAVAGQWTVRKHDEYYQPDWRKRQAAGPVLTNLIHEMDTLRHICGEVESVTGEIMNGVQGFEKEDAAAIVVRFANGALGSFAISDQVLSPWSWEFATGENPAFPKSGQNAVRFMGTKGALEFPNLVLWTSASGRNDWNSALEPTTLPTDFADAYLAQIAHFRAVIRGEAEPIIPAADAARTLAATVAVFEAARTGRRVLL